MKFSHRFWVVGAATLMVVASVAGFAHHSYTRFDLQTTLTLDGTVKEYQWTNPHVWVQLLVKNAATGAVVEWSLETDSPNMLAKRGWSRKSMQAGDRAVAIVHPLRKIVAKHEAALASISVNGKLVGPTPGNTPATASEAQP